MPSGCRKISCSHHCLEEATILGEVFEHLQRFVIMGKLFQFILCCTGLKCMRSWGNLRVFADGSSMQRAIEGARSVPHFLLDFSMYIIRYVTSVWLQAMKPAGAKPGIWTSGRPCFKLPPIKASWGCIWYQGNLKSAVYTACMRMDTNDFAN
jgi:hypothetical protein